MNSNLTTKDALSRFSHSGLVASRQIGDEILLVPINIKAGEKHGIYTLNSTASLLWNLLEKEHNIGELAEAMAEEFEIDISTAATDTQVLIDDLLSFNAIKMAE